MNKIYKVVFNETTQTWVAVGEDAKAKKTSDSSLINSLPDKSFKSKFLSLAVAMAVISPLTINEAKADSIQQGGTYTYGSTSVYNLAESDSIAFGDGAIAKGGSDNASIAIGRGAKAAAHTAKDNQEGAIDGAIAIGDNAWAITPYSVVIGSAGRGAQGLGGRGSINKDDIPNAGGYSIAIGHSSANFVTNEQSFYANTKNSTAIGSRAHTHAANALAIGFSTDATGERAFALGTGSTNEDPQTPQHKGARAAGQGSIVIGDQAVAFSNDNSKADTIRDKKVNDAIAIGTGSIVRAQNSISLGGGISYTDIAADGSKNTKYWDGSAWQNETESGKRIGANIGTGSIGGVAIGGASANSITTDSVSNYTSPATIGTNSSRAVALGSGSYVGDSAPWAFAGAGGNVTAGSARSIAIGNGSIANSQGHPDSPTIAIGYNANAIHTNAIGIGTQANATNIGTVAIGRLTQATGERSAAIGHTSNATAQDALAMMGGQAYGNSSISIGRLSKADGTGAIAFGSGEVKSNDTGKRNYDGSFAAGTGSIAIGRRAEAISANVTGIENNGGYLSIKQKPGIDGENNMFTYARTFDSADNEGKSGGQRIAIGDAAGAYKDQAIAIGGNTLAVGYASIAIGGDDIGQTYSNGSYKANSDKIQSLLGNLTTSLSDEGYSEINTLTNSTKGDEDAYKDLTLSYGDASIAFGFKSIAQGHLSNAFGTGARTLANNSIAFGTVSVAGADNSIAFGTAASTNKATANNSVAIGYMSQTGGDIDLTKTTSPYYAMKYSVDGEEKEVKSAGKLTGLSGLNSVAVGERNKVLGSNSTAVGQGNLILADNSGAFGDPNVIVQGADGSYAVGNNNTIGAKDVFVLGNDVNKVAANSVFLGDSSAYVKAEDGFTGSTAGLNSYASNHADIKANNIDAVILKTGELNFAGANATGVVSVGSAGAERRIQNVAAGLISPTSTDAINGSQLYAVVQESTPIFFNAPNATGSQAASGTSPASVKVGQNVYNLSWTAADGNGVSAPIYGGDTLTIKGKNNNIKVNFDANSQTYTLDADYSVNLTGSDVNSIDPGQHISTQPKTNDDGSKSLVVDVRTGGISPKNDGSVVPNTSNGHVALVGDVANSINNSGWNTTLSDGSTALINPADTVNYVDGKGTKANVTITQDNGKDVVNVSYDINVKSDLTKKDIPQPIANGADSTVLNLDNVTNANTTPATVSDLQNYGWVVSTNGVDNAAIRNGYTVNFKVDNNSGLTAQSSYDSATNTYNVQYGINKAQDPSITNTVGDSTKPAGVVNGGAANQYWDSQQVQNAINQSGWVVGMGKNADADKDKLINADNNRVGLVKGNNIVLTQDGSNFTIASTIDMVAGDTHYREGNHTQLSFSNEPDPNDPNKTINVAKVNVTTGGLSASDGKTTNRDLVPTSDGNFIVVDSVPVAMGAVAYDGSEGSVATIQQVANAVNNAGWLTTLSDGSTAIINPADKVNYVNGNGTKANVTTTKENGQDVVNVSYDIDVVGGKNISVTKDPNGGSTLTVATNPDVDFDSVNINKGLTVQPNANINMGGNQIHNVAAGTADTDAVNVAQLKNLVGNYNVTTYTDEAGNTYDNVVTYTDDQGKIITLKTYNVQDQTEYVTNNVVEAISKMNEQGIKFFHTNDGQSFVPQASNTVDASASGRYSTAIGYRASASGESALAIGNGSTASGANSIAIGQGNTVSGSQSIAIGYGNTVEAKGAVAIGDPILITKSATNAVALGSNSSATVANSVSLGSFSTTNRQAITGTPAVAVGDNTGAVNADGTVNTVFVMPTSDQSAIQAVAATATSTLGAVSVGYTDADGKEHNRQITHVAAGSADSDAVNVAQLKSAMGTVNNQMANLNHHIDDVDKNARAGTAAAMAVAGLPQAYLPGKSLMAVGAGTFRGQTGYAIGISSISDGGNWIIKGTASGNSQGHFGATAAIGYQW